MQKEHDFQSDLIDDLEELFPECVIMKNDASYRQGFPDLTIFCGRRWALLECKKSENEPYRPNQPYYLKKMNTMGFASMICPENKMQVLDDLILYLSGPKKLVYNNDI